MLVTDKYLDWSKCKELPDNKINVTEKLKSFLGRVDNIVGKGKNADNRQILDWSKCKELADNKINVTEKLKSFFGRVGKHCGKRRKCRLPAFSPFPTMFSEGLFIRVIKSQDYVVKRYTDI